MTLTPEILAELERLHKAISSPHEYNMVANMSARCDWFDAVTEHLPTLIAAARERDRLVERGVCGCGDVMPPCVRCRPITDPELERLSLLEGFEHLRKQRAKLKADLLATRRALRLAQGILETLEWIQDENGDEHCPSCGHSPGRHSNDCEWALVMRERMAADCGEEMG